MTDRSLIPEFIVGVASLYVFQWLFPLAMDIQKLTVKLDPSVSGNISLVIQGSMCILILGMYGIVGFYCMLICIERSIRFATAYRNRDKIAAEEPMKRVEDYIGDLQTSSEVLHTNRK
jgi:hypothetical protein